ncbi:hypothetical protein Pmar_PMAR029445 [Perkinsus marinus ATCC 50983]|uniref:Uncharacterized protein n=1 Tax=Perkinsus marinus (strain ATCC 50983 / TXsc) TaxID=423536 RepID=C5KGP7_PERM5|nr:hypothetical protein Pmar_PMAR029445 [Perkinsus marinus ATCC 50983]EER16315.1 hypothetical protein Pmar_PMAR029445 [Perkinsus marinus ATCC 50983]|eukprot:XP_002784519.1 hypothetical protein Pmar_PMAR029445 [Perkinsus marinus ATCC 50983]
MEEEGEDNDDDNKEEGYTTWRWWEASTFEERERLWSNLEEAFTREMRMARDKDEERRRLRIERKRQHAQAERAAVDTTDPYFKAAAKAEVNSFDRRTAGWRAFNRKKRKKNYPHSIQGDEVEEEEEEGPSKWIEGARGLGGSDIGSSNEEEDKEEECMGRYLSTSLKSTVEALHSISSKDLQTYLMSINDDLLLHQGGHHQDYWSTIAKSGRELKEGHRRDVVIGNGVGVAHRVDNDCDINGDVLMGSVGVEGEVGGEAPKKYEHSTHEYVHPNGPSIYPMVVDVWSVALVLLIIHVHAYGPTFNDIVDIIRKHQKVHWGALLALVHGEEKNILSPLLMNLIDISFDIRDDINDFINHPYFLKEVLPSITDHDSKDWANVMMVNRSMRCIMDTPAGSRLRHITSIREPFTRPGPVVVVEDIVPDIHLLLELPLDTTTSTVWMLPPHYHTSHECMMVLPSHREEEEEADHNHHIISGHSTWLVGIDVIIDMRSSSSSSYCYYQYQREWIILDRYDTLAHLRDKILHMISSTITYPSHLLQQPLPLITNLILAPVLLAGLPPPSTTDVHHHLLAVVGDKDSMIRIDDDNNGQLKLMDDLKWTSSEILQLVILDNNDHHHHNTTAVIYRDYAATLGIMSIDNDITLDKEVVDGEYGGGGSMLWDRVKDHNDIKDNSMGSQTTYYFNNKKKKYSAFPAASIYNTTQRVNAYCTCGK